ncbi:MAG: hypothetical protein OEV44_05590 [Spirochaetota bacterium]|nr:hypothetical protein [Spirochaetota bacterium]
MEINEKFNPSLVEGWIGIVYCLSIDMISSTEAALKRTKEEQNRFNKFLVKQIVPHIENLGLKDALIQFTGDGWLVMIQKEKKIPALCCLAVILSRQFQEEMSKLTGININNISPLRLAISWGVDMCVELPDRRKHWVGDSARRAVRASGCCYPNEIIIDYSVTSGILQDFKIDPVNIEKRQASGLAKKMEEDLHLYSIIELTPTMREDLVNPECFIYTLNVIGKTIEAENLLNYVSEKLTEKTAMSNADKDKLLKQRNLLLARVPNYSIAKQFMNTILADGLTPNVFTYNAIIEQSPDYETAKSWMDKMKESSVKPNIISYKHLLEKISDYQTANEIFEEMENKNISPDINVYNILISKAPSYNIAKTLLDELNKKKIPTNFLTYNTLIEKTQNFNDAKYLMDEMEQNGIPPNVMTYNLLLKRVANYDEASELMSEIEKRGISTDIVF